MHFTLLARGRFGALACNHGLYPGNITYGFATLCIKWVVVCRHVGCRNYEFYTTYFYNATSWHCKLHWFCCDLALFGQLNYTLCVVSHAESQSLCYILIHAARHAGASPATVWLSHNVTMFIVRRTPSGVSGHSAPRVQSIRTQIMTHQSWT